MLQRSNQIFLSASERLALIQALNQLPLMQLEELVVALNPPAGVLPPINAAQGNRTSELLRWVEGPTGSGLSQLQALLSQLISPSYRATGEERDSIWQSPLNPGAPFPRVRLPENFVERPDALNAVKGNLLAGDDRALVVSAISGLGGIGKSVLATAVVLDPQVRAWFADGILWVTLGQQPDLQMLLGDWIRQLDTSREAFSANTLESAKQYLDRLLADRRILLVVDDVWDAYHVEYFRVGGPECRVLVTTRTAFIPEAERYSLDLMSPEESVALMRGELREQWKAAMEGPAREFAELLGYLPLALKLMAVQVMRGREWKMLKKEFLREEERLGFADDPRAGQSNLSEDERRRYSLRSCFGLSLQWLEPELLERFTWLGVLPEDATIHQQMAMTLWSIQDFEAEKTLVSLYESSLLTAGLETLEGKKTYRMHDLLHLIAQELIEPSQNIESTSKPKSIIQNLPHLGLTLAEAHAQLLARYRSQVPYGCWDRLPNDGYIHRHLTWHMEQANWADEVHALMAMNDAQGRNAWFEACDLIGQPSIFVEDVARGWALAEEGYASGSTRSIVLQCRYALITATLNSLVASLPISVMAEFVKQKFWTIEQAWVYVEQIRDEQKLAEAIRALAPYLSKALFQSVLAAAWVIKSESRWASVLSELAKVDGAYFTEALTAARVIKSESRRVSVLGELAKVEEADFTGVLEVARAIQDESSRAYVLVELAKVDGAYFTEALAAARAIQDESSQASVLRELAKVEGADFTGVLDVARAIQDESSQASVLRELAKVEGGDFTGVLDVARAIQDESSRASILVELAKVYGAYFTEALAAALVIQDESSRTYVLRELAKVEGGDFTEVLAAARAIQDESSQASVLVELAKVDGAYFTEALAAARVIQDESSRASVLVELTKVDGAYFTEALAAARAIQDESRRASVLRELAKVEGGDFTGVLAAARAIQDESSRTSVLRELAKVEGGDFTGVLAAVRTIQDESSWASVLVELARVDGAYFTEALAAARAIQDDESRVSVLGELAKVEGGDFTEALAVVRVIRSESRRAYLFVKLARVDGAYFTEALAAARAIRSESSRAYVLVELAKIGGADFSGVLGAACAIQSESSRAYVLRELAKVGGANFSGFLEAVRAIQSESSRASVLVELAKVDGAYFTQALAAARAIQDDESRASVLVELAKVDGAYFTQALAAARAIQDDESRASVLVELAKVDGAYFTQALAAARAIQDESSRASVLIELAKVDGGDFTGVLAAVRAIQDESSRASVLGELAKVKGADFTGVLAAARAIQDESSRASVLRELAKVEGGDFTGVLAAVRAIQDEYRRVSVLGDLAKHAPQEFLTILWNEIFSFNHKPPGAKSLSQSLLLFLMTGLLHSDWQSSLRLLSHRQRSDLMQDLVTLYPVIIDLGGETAMRGVVDEMCKVCNQWK